jgi:hypothetical protein
VDHRNGRGNAVVIQAQIDAMVPASVSIEMGPHSRNRGLVKPEKAGIVADQFHKTSAVAGQALDNQSGRHESIYEGQPEKKNGNAIPSTGGSHAFQECRSSQSGLSHLRD